MIYRFSHILSFILIFNLCSYAQKPISVHELKSKFNSDWWNHGAVLVDTFKVNPFTGVVYLHHVFESFDVDKNQIVLAYICHFENGYKDGFSISFYPDGNIREVINYSKGERLGVEYFKSHERMTSSYEDKNGRMIEYWDDHESIHEYRIIEFERRTDSKGNIIYEKYYDKNGNQISYDEYIDLTKPQKN